MIDDLLNYYLALEKTYICNAFSSGLKQEQANMITLCEKETAIERQVQERVIDSGKA